MLPDHAPQHRSPGLWAALWRVFQHTRSSYSARKLNASYALDDYARKKEPVPASLAARVRDEFPELAGHELLQNNVAARAATLDATLLSQDIFQLIVRQLPRLPNKGSDGNPVMHLGALADALTVCRPWAAVVALEAIRSCAAIHYAKLQCICEKRQAALAHRYEEYGGNAESDDQAEVRSVHSKSKWKDEERQRADAVRSLIQRLKAEEAVRNSEGQSAAHAALIRLARRQAELQALLVDERRYCDVENSGYDPALGTHSDNGIPVWQRPSYDKDDNLGGFRIGDRVFVQVDRLSLSSPIHDNVRARRTGTVIRFLDPDNECPSYSMVINWDSVVTQSWEHDVTQSCESEVGTYEFACLHVIDIGWRELERRALHTEHVVF